ncbi:MAG: hypothetical protein K6L81_17720 [Agarilytica sp.]
MFLRIRKSQKKGVMGKTTFELHPELVLSDHERKLIKHYGLQKQQLASKKIVSMFGNPLETETSINVEELWNGDSYKCKSLEEVINYRNKLIEACKNLKVFLDVAETFEGVEEIDIDALLSEKLTEENIEELEEA